jgi:hypothetical protein
MVDLRGAATEAAAAIIERLVDSPPVGRNAIEAAVAEALK